VHTGTAQVYIQKRNKKEVGMKTIQ